MYFLYFIEVQKQPKKTLTSVLNYLNDFKKKTEKKTKL